MHRKEVKNMKELLEKILKDKKARSKKAVEKIAMQEGGVRMDWV